jgi:periplasmic protein CpxP/Spy
MEYSHIFTRALSHSYAWMPFFNGGHSACSFKRCQMMFKGKLILQRGSWLGAVAAVAAVTLSLASPVWAQHGHGEQRGGMGGGMLGNPERMGRMMDHMLDGLNATDAQRSQIKQIAQTAATDMKAQRESNRALHEKAMQVFAAPNVDAAAAEQVRQQMLVQHDQMSKRTLQAMLDASKVLTPEQRATLGERMKQRSDTMRDRMKRMMGERREAPKS